MADAVARSYGVLPSTLLDLSPFDLGFTMQCWLTGRAQLGSAMQQAQQGEGVSAILSAVLSTLALRL